MTLDKLVTEPPSLQQLFPGGDFAWAFRMRKADPTEFFTPQDASQAVLEEKNRILDEKPQDHLVFSDEAHPLMEPLQVSLQSWGGAIDGEATFESMARNMEPDLIVMNQANQRLAAAAVCFPSSWDPSQWGGQAIRDIHAVIPQLNAQIGEMIERFLTELKPGKSFQRANWSFTRSAELNYHPALNRPPLDPSIQLEEVSLRIEHQLFTAIEGAVLMGIRIQPIPILSLSGESPLWQNVIQILETMPEDVARYKNLHLGKTALIKLMRSR